MCLSPNKFPIDAEKGKSEIFTRTDHIEKIGLLISHFELPKKVLSPENG